MSYTPDFGKKTREMKEEFQESIKNITKDLSTKINTLDGLFKTNDLARLQNIAKGLYNLSQRVNTLIEQPYTAEQNEKNRQDFNDELDRIKLNIEKLNQD